MTIGIVSTFSKAGYEEYAKFFVEGLKNNLDKNVQVFLYLDDMNITDLPSNIHIIDFNKVVPELKIFRERNKDKTFKNFMTDACRFSFKSYAWCHAGLTKGVDKLIWLDADSEIYSHVSEKYLDSKIPNEYFTSHLWRENYGYTETGWLAWNLNHPASSEWFQRYKAYYDSDSIYSLPAFTDCHVYDAVTTQMKNENKINVLNLSPIGIKKDHFNHAFKGHIVHFKGDRVKKREKLLKSLKGQ